MYGMKKALIALILVSSMSACTQHQDRYQDKALSEQEALDGWQARQTNAVQVTQITDLVQDERLDALIQEALKENPGLHQTLMTLQQSYTAYDVANSERIPDLTAGYSTTKKENMDTEYSGSLSVTWELDFWQKLSDSAKAAELDIKNTELVYQEARDVLAANVMRAWLKIILNRQLTDIQQKRVALLESNEALIMTQYRSGLGDLGDLDDAKSSAESARSTLVEYQQNLVTAQRNLHLLLGHKNQNQSFDIGDAFPSSLQPLASLPKQDLARRPDLQQAYIDIKAKEYEAKAAYKALLPSFSLTATYSDSGDSPSEALFKNPVWTLLGQLSAPLFSGGKLRAQAKSADYATAKSYYQYQETLLTAINEVETCLDLENGYTSQKQHLTTSLKSGNRSLENYEDKYRKGLATIYELISAQTNVMDLKVKLVNKKYDLLANRIDLGLALGLGVKNENKQ